MFRYTISLSLVLGLIGCGKVIPPLNMDLNSTAEKRHFAYNPSTELTSYYVRGADAVKSVSGLRGVGLSSDYGYGSKLVSDAQSIFSYYPTVVAAMYSMTIKTSSFDSYFRNYFYPNYGNGQFPYWGGASQVRSWGAYNLELTTTSNVSQYRIAIEYPEDSNYDGYTATGSPYGRRRTSISAWDRDATGKILKANILVLAGSVLYLEVADGKSTAKTAAESPTFAMSATLTPAAGSSGTVSSMAAVSATHDFSSIVATATGIPAGFQNQVNGDSMTVGDVSIDVRGINNNTASVPSYCYYGYYCYQAQ